MPTKIAMAGKKNIALVAHDKKKEELCEWARFNRDVLAEHSLYATATTDHLLMTRLGLNVTCLKSGPLGGDQQIGAQIAEGQIDCLIFFSDPLEPPPRIEPLGIRAADGRLHELDIIIYATGFETSSFLSVMDINGRDGRSLREEWHNGASAYYGMAVAGFPNFFMLYGPNTNLGHNSIIAMLECQFEYILQAQRLMHERQASALEIRPDAMQRFDREVKQRLQGRAWASGCTSWYKNASGRIKANWWGSIEDYKRETARLEVDDFELAPAAELAFGDR
jgi:methylglyoxal synthase